MIIQRVTLTGADDSVDPKALIDLSAEFPFVEWGILVSESSEGSNRFPTRKWIDSLVDLCGGRINLSSHICGRWVRHILVGNCEWPKMPSCVMVSERIQLNTHAQHHHSRAEAFGELKKLQGRQFIFQWDGVNDHNAIAAKNHGVDAVALFDKSGGAGVLPETWPRPRADVKCGFAGGLGPDNIAAQIERISKVCPHDYATWIDMERKIRSDDDKKFDLTRCRAVLEVVKEIGLVVAG